MHSHACNEVTMVAALIAVAGVALGCAVLANLSRHKNSFGHIRE